MFVFQDNVTRIQPAAIAGPLRDEDVNIFERSVQDPSFDLESLSEANLMDMEQPMGRRPETVGQEQQYGKREGFEDSEDSMKECQSMSWFCCYHY